MPRLAVLFVLSAASSPCPDLNLIHYIFEDIVFLGKRLFTVRKFLDFSELLEMVNTQGYFLEFLYLYECIGVKTSDYFLEAVLVTGRSRKCKKCFIKIMGASSFVYQWNNLRLDNEIV